MTNLLAAKVFLSRACDGGHQHGVLEGNIPGQGRRTTLAQVYPDKLVKAMVDAIKLQKKWDNDGTYVLGCIGNGELMNVESGETIPPEEEDSVEFEEAWDDITNDKLKPTDVRKARLEYLQYY